MIEPNPFTISPGIVALPVSHQTWPVGDLGGLRLGFSAGALPQATLDAVNTTALSKRPGAGQLSDTLNRRFWFRETPAGLELSFDNTPQPANGVDYAGLRMYPFFGEFPYGGGYDAMGARCADGTTVAAAQGLTSSRVYRGMKFSAAAPAGIPLGCPYFYHQLSSGDAVDYIVADEDTAAGCTVVIAYKSGRWDQARLTLETRSSPLGLELNMVDAAASTLNAGTFASDVLRLFGVNTAGEGDPSMLVYWKDTKYATAWTHPGGTGWRPAVGVRAHGVHPMIKMLRILDGEVVETRFATTGNQIADCFRSWKALCSPDYGPTLDSTADSVAAGVGDKQVLLRWTKLPFGPLDVYDCRQIARALDQGASISDIDDHVTSGKKCALWRSEQLNRSAANVVAWVPGAGPSIVVRNARKVAGVAELINAPTIGKVLVSPMTTYGIGNDRFLDAEAMLAELSAIYPALELELSSSDDIEVDMKKLASSLGDLPYLWWQSAGFSGITGLVTSVITAAFVPGKVPTTP